MALGIGMGKGIVTLGVNAAPLYRGLAIAKGALRGFAGGARRALRSLTRLPAMFGVAGIGGAVAFSVKKFADFEQQMARTRAISGAVGSAFSSMREQALELGRTTRFSATQAAEAMGNFALAGFKAEEIVASMPATLNLAAAGMLDMGTASSIVSKVMRAMGLSARELDHVVDVMVGAFTTANTDLIQLGDAFRYVAPIAKSAGYSLEETTAAIQLLSDAGLQGTMAGTGLRKIIMTLGGGRAAVEFGTLGIELRKADGQLRSLSAHLIDMKQAFAQIDPLRRAKMVELFGVRAGPALEVFLERGGHALEEYVRKLHAVGGVSKRIARIQEDTLMGSFIRLKSAVEGIAIVIGQQFAQKLRKMAETIAANGPKIAKFAKDTIQQIMAMFKAIMRGWDPFKRWLLAEVDELIAAIGSKIKRALIAQPLSAKMDVIREGLVRRGFKVPGWYGHGKNAGAEFRRAFEEELAKIRVSRHWGQPTSEWPVRTRPPGVGRPVGAGGGYTVPPGQRKPPPVFTGFPAAGGGGGGGGGGFMGAAQMWKSIQESATQKSALEVAREQAELLQKQLDMLMFTPRQYVEQKKVNDRINSLTESIERWAKLRAGGNVNVSARAAP